MKALKRYKYHLLAVLLLGGLLAVGSRTRISAVSKTPNDLPKVGQAFQMDQALELLTAKQSRMAFTAAAGIDMRYFIFDVVKKALPTKYEDRAFEIARAVITEANHHKLDPLFLLAVIATESQFNVGARGSHGEIGLMQVLPKTAKWLAPQAGLQHDFDLEDPAVNIRLGATYFAHLRRTFKGHTKRYIGAYNMGVRNVRKLIKVKVEPQLYPSRVLGNYSQIYLAAGEVTSTENVARGLALAE